MTRRQKERLLVLTLALALFVGIGLLIAWIFMLLWNAVVAGIFGLWRPLTYWQAFLVWTFIYLVGGAFKATTSGSTRS